MMSLTDEVMVGCSCEGGRAMESQEHDSAGSKRVCSNRSVLTV